MQMRCRCNRSVPTICMQRVLMTVPHRRPRCRHTNSDQISYAAQRRGARTLMFALLEVDVAMGAGLDRFRLDGRVALLTGGGGVIATAVAEGFAEAGAAILVADRNAEAAEKTASGLS